MKKTVTAVIVLLSVVYLLSCKMTKSPAYEFPVEMAPNIQIEYAAQCEKGQILYELNCAKCHNQKVRGKSVIPDFTEEQLVGYKLRATNPDHAMHLTDETVSAEELGYIMTFLTYKKKNSMTTAGK